MSDTPVKAALELEVLVAPCDLAPPLLPVQAQLKPRDSSVEVRSEWEVKEEMDFPRLMKMRYMEVADPVDM